MLAQESLLAVGAAKPTEPLVMLAHGDFWFDRFLPGNGLPITDTYIIAELRTMGDINPVIANVSHYGDATTDEMSLPKQERMIQVLGDPANWLQSCKPDAILFSGGGNDIVGEQFCIYLDYVATGGSGLDSSGYQKAPASVEVRYEDRFDFREH